MVLKFSYANEIHRCSEFPKKFDQLHSFLIATFKAGLPEKYELRYIYPGTEAERQVTNQNEYDELLKLESSKSIKVTIRECLVFNSDYDIIGNNNLKSQGVVEDEAPSLEKIVEHMSESIVVPQVKSAVVPDVNKLSYFSYVPVQDEHIRQVVRDVVKEHIPFIISQVKDAVLQELRGAQSIARSEKEQIVILEEPKKAQPEEKKDQHFDKFSFYRGNEEAEDIFKPELIKPVEHVPYEEKFVKYEEEEDVEVNIASEEKENPFFAKIKDIGKAIKGQVVELPGKAMKALDDWSHKIEDDPYVIIEEGRYPRSVVDKAHGLKEVFIDESLKTLLDFINRYPRTATLEQLAHAFLFKDQQQQQNNEPEHLDQPPVNNNPNAANNVAGDNQQYWV